MNIVGYKSQFTHSWRDDETDDGDFESVFETYRGPGLNPEIKGEGIRKNNCIPTLVADDCRSDMDGE